MKTRLLIPLIAACAPVLFAQSPGVPQEGGPMRMKMREKMKENFPPELYERFNAAREKVMQDPAIQGLKQKADASAEEFRKAMREAMMKADPGLAEILKERMGERLQGGKDGRRGGPDGAFANLSEGDRQKLMAAREQAKNDPEVQAAEAKKTEAKTPEERHAAMQEFHKAMQAALLKADPTLGPILEQLKPKDGPRPPKPGMAPGA